MKNTTTTTFGILLLLLLSVVSVNAQKTGSDSNAKWDMVNITKGNSIGDDGLVEHYPVMNTTNARMSIVSVTASVPNSTVYFSKASINPGEQVMVTVITPPNHNSKIENHVVIKVNTSAGVQDFFMSGYSLTR